MAKVPNGENFNRLSRVHERHRQTTDGRAITYSERECEFTFDKTDKRRMTQTRQYDIPGTWNLWSYALQISYVDWYTRVLVHAWYNSRKSNLFI